ncbi:MAG TPA: S41 family peptidase [Gaiellaceae bacterium]|nr:S41 family peptidase [Gaiellaceae bacterium]
MRDAESLSRLLRERHFGVATGLVEPPDEALAVWERRLAGSPRTWGAAVAELQFDLREALRDEHVRILGAARRRDGRVEEEEPGPAVEETVVAGVLVVRVRRLIGDPADETQLARWRAAADRHFSYDRIVVDLRANPGGNDGHTFEWAQRRFRAVRRHVRESLWAVRGRPLGNWNAFAWRAASDATAVPPHLVAGRHDPLPDDRIELHRAEHPLEAGDRPWNGEMLVLVDRRTRSSGESSAWLLRDGLGARLVGSPTTGMIEYGNIVPYVLPESGLVIQLPTKHNDYGFTVESVGFPVDVSLADDAPAAEIAAEFESFL